MCVGHKDKLRRQEYLERELNYNIISGWADPKKLPKKQVWWRIEGEPVPKPIKLTKATLKKLNEFNSFIKSYGWRKKQNG